MEEREGNVCSLTRLCYNNHDTPLMKSAEL